MILSAFFVLLVDSGDFFLCWFVLGNLCGANRELSPLGVKKWGENGENSGFVGFCGKLFDFGRLRCKINIK